jgi:hypothetical protein
MKYPISLATLLALSLATKAQSKTSLSTLPGITINLKESGPAVSPAFSHFEVIDQRPDTARIGIHTFVPTFGRSRNRQLVFSQPAATEISAWLNRRFARPDAHWTALIVLRSLWLCDASYLLEDRQKDPQVTWQRTHIRLKAEIYAFNGSVYIPIMRFDTLQTYKRSNQYNNLNSYYSLWENDLTSILGEMTDSSSSLTPAKVEHGRHLQLGDILQFNRSRFDLPIAGATAPDPGVYTSFQEFRDNTPSAQYFEVRQEKADHLLYIRDADGAPQYSHNAWGCSDGKNWFIMRDGKLYRMIKVGNAFYFFSPPIADPDPPQTNSPDHNSPANNSPGNTRAPYTTYRIYTVDMDSGAIY